MFSLRNFVKTGLLKAIGIQSDYWVMLTAANWFTKGVLEEEDMIEIQTKIDEKNTPVEEPIIEEEIEQDSAEIEEETVESAENIVEESEDAE